MTENLCTRFRGLLVEWVFGGIVWFHPGPLLRSWSRERLSFLKGSWFYLQTTFPFLRLRYLHQYLWNQNFTAFSYQAIWRYNELPLAPPRQLRIAKSRSNFQFSCCLSTLLLSTPMLSLERCLSAAQTSAAPILLPARTQQTQRSTWATKTAQ